MSKNQKETIPELGSRCNSWIVSDKDGQPICETWLPKLAQKFLNEGYIVKTSEQHLCDLNG